MRSFYTTLAFCICFIAVPAGAAPLSYEVWVERGLSGCLLVGESPLTLDKLLEKASKGGFLEFSISNGASKDHVQLNTLHILGIAASGSSNLFSKLVPCFSRSGVGSDSERIAATGTHQPAAGDLATSTGGPLESSITLAELDAVLTNLPLFLSQARGVPFFQAGKSIGMRLFAIKSGSFYDRIGLKNADIVMGYEGEQCTDMPCVVKLPEVLRTKRELVIKVGRSDQVFDLKVKVEK